MDLFDDEQVTTADQVDRPEQALEKEAIDDFMKRNPMAGGGMLVQPSADGRRPGYMGKNIMSGSPAQQAENIRRENESLKKISDLFQKKDYTGLKTRTPTSRIKQGMEDKGGKLNQAQVGKITKAIEGGLKTQKEFAKKLGITLKQFLDGVEKSKSKISLEKSETLSKQMLKKIEFQEKLFKEILNNPNATVDSMTKKFKVNKKYLVSQSSKLLKNVYAQNVSIAKGPEFDLDNRGKATLKSWLPDDFNTTDNFLDNFSNIKGLKKVQTENIGTLIRNAFGRGQSPKKYTQALAALSEYNKLTEALPKGLKLNLDHPLSKAFLKGSNVPADQLLFVTPISSDYNKGFKAKLDTAYKKALLNPDKDKKLIKTIENFADTIGVNIGKGSTKKFDFGTANIAKKTKADFAAELVQNLREQKLARQNLSKFQKTKEGKDIIKQIFPKGQKIQIPATNTKGLAAFMKREFPEIPCKLSKGTGCNNAQAYQNAVDNLTQKASQGDEAAKATLSKFGNKVATAGKFIKGALGPLALATEVAVDLAIPLNQTLQEGVPYKQAFADTLINKYILGPKLQVDKEAEIAKEMAKGEEFAMAKRGERMFLPQSATADAQRLKKREEEMKALYPQLDFANLSNKEIDKQLADSGVYSPYTLGFGMQQKQPGIGDMRYNEDVAYDEIRDIFNKGAEEDIRKQQMQSIADAGGVANLAGGGIAGLSGGDPEGAMLTSMNPDSQGLSGLLKRGIKT